MEILIRAADQGFTVKEVNIEKNFYKKYICRNNV
jgi:hypothetical protein